ncbi:MAG: AAA family ATPase [Chloroflexota bacterium]|nr:AAA family ATPase [Chloroflexota bacterium]
MPTYELSFTPTFYNESMNLPKQVTKQVAKKLKVLTTDPSLAQGDAKQIKGYSNLYRVRIGDYRLFYSFGQGWVKLLSVRKRDERTYEDEVPDFSVPVAAPQPQMLEPQPEPAKSKVAEVTVEYQAGATPPTSPATPLPYTLTEELLTQWQIPAEYHAAVLGMRTADDVLALDIPPQYATRILDNLFPRPIEEIAVQPEYVLNEPEDLERLVEGELTAFLLKLAPEQQALLEFGGTGPTLVKGGPGTGKSTLALYRVQRMLEQDGGPILFTTYTNALVAYSEQLLAYLLGGAPSDHGVKVSTVDSLASHYYAKAYGWPAFATEGQALAHVEAVLVSTELPGANVFDRRVRQQTLHRLGPAYLLQEFLTVIEAWGLSSRDEYLAIERRGRGVALRGPIREAVWAVYEAWRVRIMQDGRVLWEQVRRGALESARTLPKKPFQALIIDEAQDLSPVALRFLLALVESPERVYLTADASQSIYQRGFSWKQIHADLNVRGRTLLLKRNFRNTAQIAAACATILAGTSAGDAESITQEPSPHTGEPPMVMLVDDLAGQVAAIHDFFMDAARRFRLPVHSGAVLCPHAGAGREIAQRLTKLGVPAEFMASKAVDVTKSHVKVLTLRASKGLEFPFVAVVGLDQGQLPRIDDDLPPEEAETVMDEQRRIFYVGCSRAMRALLVTGAAAAPSPFLAPLTPPMWRRKDLV